MDTLAPTWVNTFLAIASVATLAGLVGLFFWLLDGWIKPGFWLFIFALGIAFLFTVFAWLIFIALGVVCTLIAGIIIGSDSGKDAGA